MNSQDQIFQKNWKIYSEKMNSERSSFSDADLIYQGRKFYDINNPPFVASIVKIPNTLWEPLQLIQGDLERTDDRQTYFHPIYFHITLIEFGWQDQVKIDELEEKLKKYVQEIPPFDIQIRGINCFERILFAQVFDKKKGLN